MKRILKGRKKGAPEEGVVTSPSQEQLKSTAGSSTTPDAEEKSTWEMNELTGGRDDGAVDADVAFRGGGGKKGGGGRRGGGSSTATAVRQSKRESFRQAVDSAGAARPSYRLSDRKEQGDDDDEEEDEEEEDEEEEEEDEQEGTDVKANIEHSAGTTRLNRILRATGVEMSGSYDNAFEEEEFQQHTAFLFGEKGGFGGMNPQAGLIERQQRVEKVHDPTNMEELQQFCSTTVIPPLKVDPNSIGGSMLEGYPETMQVECLYAASCQSFESTGQESVALSALQYPSDYQKHKRALGLFGTTSAAATTTAGTAKSRANKLRYVLIARSTNRPVVDRAGATGRNRAASARQQQEEAAQRQQRGDNDEDDASEREDYDAMFSPDAGGGGGDDDGSVSADVMETPAKKPGAPPKKKAPPPSFGDEKKESKLASPDKVITADEEVSSFPVLICMTLHSDGTAPDIRKLIPLERLTTVQDLHSTVVQLAFSNGDTVRLDFGNDNENKVVERPLDKERFIWSLLQIHAMLCMTVVEHHSMSSAGREQKIYLPALNIRNLDRAELQYVATVNGFLRNSETLRGLLDRQRSLVQSAFMPDGIVSRTTAGEEKVDLEEMDSMAYDLMMGNFATRVTLFHSEDERKDAEEILNSFDWTDMLANHETAAMSVAERLGFLLQARMRDLEAETCRRLIAWEDEKQLSMTGQTKLHDSTDERDTVDALALASLFKTLESLDTELKSMEDWLQDRAAAIKPLTDDCADIEEENRQLEQQWKSYDMLGAELRRLQHGLEIDEYTEVTLKNPASALVYDEEGLVDVDESEEGIERIYQAGKVMLEATEFPRSSGCMHLKAVTERSQALTKVSNGFCSALAQIIVTVMEQFKTEVVAGSDHGKVSKNDTHAIISKKIRDTQRKFQSSLLQYIKLIEILAALSPEMLPALRDAYAEMVAEGILMKKRMKGYFQALPGKNAAFANKPCKNLKDYVPFMAAAVPGKSVNAPDIKAALSELLPVIAREAYFTSALFGSHNNERDGREKKRNFENAKTAVDKASTHFRYYVNRTCGISGIDDSANLPTAGETNSDPLICFVATIYLNEAMDHYIDREKKGGDHSLSLAYVRATILDLRKKADKQWVAWVDKQLEWIKSIEGVPLNGKRAGIFPSFARFPKYIDHILMCCREGRDEGYTPDLKGIKVINYYLQKIAVTLLESLKEAAGRETTDQSYAANVMQMENTYFFAQAMKDRGEMISELFAKQITKANAICKDSTDAYLGWMIKREFAALHELFSKVSKIRKEQGDKEVVKEVPKAQFVRALQKEANRDILKEKIGAMYSRMEKHLSDEGELLPIAWKALVKVLYEWFGRWEKLCSTIYKHKLDPTPVDVVRIAKAAGGGAKPKPQAEGSEFGFKSILALGNKSSSNITGSST